MNNETNQNLISNNQEQPVLNQQQQVLQTIQTQTVIQQQNQISTQQQVPTPQVFQQVPTTQVFQQAPKAPVDFNSLSPLEKQQLIDRAIREANLKCQIEKPKGFNKLTAFIVGMILLCVVCVIILNILK